MNQKLIDILTVIVVLVGVSIPFIVDPPLGGGHHNKQRSNKIALSVGTRTSGPILRGYSEFAEFFNIKIGSDIYASMADDGYLEFDFFPLKLFNGRHRVEVTPINTMGEAPKVIFNLQITGKNPRLWQILLLKEKSRQCLWKVRFLLDILKLCRRR